MFKKLLFIALLASMMPLPVFGSDLDAFERHLNRKHIRQAIQDLNEGTKAFCFIPTRLTDNQKSFLKNLDINLPQECIFGKRLMIIGHMLFSQEDKTSESSRYTQAKDRLQNFFTAHTTAPALKEMFPDIDGPKFLSNYLLECTEILFNEENSGKSDLDKNSCVTIDVSICKKNDVFKNFLRWHYDMERNPTPRAAEVVKLVGVFFGSPTIFGELNEGEKEKFHKIMPIYRPFLPSIPTYPENCIQHLINNRDRYSIDSPQYKNIDDEIKKAEILKENKEDKLLEHLGARVKLDSGMRDTGICPKMIQAGPQEIALFTVTGRQPALHSEPDMNCSRIFFSITYGQDNWPVKIPLSMIASDVEFRNRS